MAFKMKGSSYKMGGVKTKDTMAYMKSPLEQGSTSFIDKVKAAGGALYDNVGKVHGHGTSNSFSSNVAKSYGKKKKGYRKEAADSSKKKSPLEQAKPDYIDIDKDGNTTESMKEASMAKMKSPLEQQLKETKKEQGEALANQTMTAEDEAFDKKYPNQSKAYLNTKQTQKSLTRREINKKLKEEKKFQKGQKGQNKKYSAEGRKTKVPNVFSSRTKKEKYLNTRDENKKDKRGDAMSR